MKTMKNKLLIILGMCMLMMSSAFALTVSYDQQQNLVDYYSDSKGNKFTDFYNGYENISEIPISSGNTTVFAEFDYKLDLLEANEDFYLILYNFFENTTYTFYHTTDLNTQKDIFYRNITLEETGEYYFKYSPSSADERSVVYIDMLATGGNSFFELSYQEVKPASFNSIIGTIYDSFSEIIEINISIWKVIFYLLMFVLALSFVLSLFGLGFLFFKWAKKLREGETPEETNNKYYDVDYEERDNRGEK